MNLPVSRAGARRRSTAALLVLAVLVAALAVTVLQLRRDLDSAHGRLAAAYRLHRAGDLDEAVAAYGEIGARDGAALHRIARYNMAGIHLEQAQKLPLDSEQRVPLVELAKQLYRDVLREQPQHWDARYNLSRALEIVPDVELGDLEEERNPERAPRAPRANPAYEQLP